VPVWGRLGNVTLSWGVRNTDLAADAVGPLVKPFFIVVDDAQLIVGGALLYQACMTW
jgi:hypothetical protein